jgi:outer membrane lipoprotein-sorting protein
MERRNTLIRFINALAALLLFAFAGSVATQEEPTGLEIMTHVDERDDGDDQKSRALFELINKRGQTRERNTIRFWKDYDGKDDFDAKMMTFFESPPDVEGTGFLSWSYEDVDKDDDQWLYLPALRRVRRIAASDKGDSFMGTDFTYDDMGERKVEEDTHTLLGTENLDATPCYKVESKPKEEDYIYSRKITWVDAKEWIPIRVDYYDRKGNLLKTLTTEWQQIDGIWTWDKATMKNHQTGHQTVIDVEDVELNTGLSDDDLTTRMLERGPRY